MLKPLIIGHRGASASAPENTMQAFELAVADGADGLEFDVRLAVDGVPVVIHDADLRRTGSSDAAVATTSSSNLRKQNVGHWFNQTHPKLASVAFEAARVPLLNEVFERFASSALVLYVEIKAEPATADRLASAVVGLINEFRLHGNVVVESFDLDAIATIKSLDRELKTAALFEPGFNPRSLSIGSIIEKAGSARADEIALHHSLLTAARTKRIIDAGFDVAVWTVDRPRWIQFATVSGIKSLITNSPSTMVSAREHS